MNASLKRAGRIALWILAACVALGGAYVGNLVYIGTPDAASSLRFQGFVMLPARNLLNVLDYLTISGRTMFITSESSGDVYKIGLDGSAPDRTAVAVFASEPATHGVVVDPVSRLAFVTRSEVNSVDVFNPATMRLVKRIAVAEDADGIFYDPVDKLVYAASGDAKLATIIDPASQTRIGTIPLGGKPEFAVFDAKTVLFYQNLQDTNAIVAVDVRTRKVVQHWPLADCAGPSGIAMDAAQRRLFVVCSGNANLVIVDANTHHVTGSLPIGGGPDSVAYDPGLHRVYATGKAGVLSVIQQDGPDNYHQLDSIHLHYGAHTLAVDPLTHAVYAGYASLLVSPRLAVFMPTH